MNKFTGNKFLKKGLIQESMSRALARFDGILSSLRCVNNPPGLVRIGFPSKGRPTSSM